MEFATCCPTCDEFACGVDELRCGFCGFRMQFGPRRAGYSRHVSIPAPRPPVPMVGNPRAAANVNDIVQVISQDLLSMVDGTDQVYIVLLAVRESTRERDTRAAASVQAEDFRDSDFEDDFDSDSDFEDVLEEIPEPPPPLPPRAIPDTCYICMDQQQDSLLSPCGHAICGVCGFEVREHGNRCPWCMENIEDIVPMET